jgi:hypothetical protein
MDGPSNPHGGPESPTRVRCALGWRPVGPRPEGGHAYLVNEIQEIYRLPVCRRLAVDVT